MGGSLQVISKKNKIVALEISFKNQSVDFAPMLETTNDPNIKAHIVGRDTLLPFVKMQLEDAFAYLQCYFHVEVVVENIQAQYIAESSEEEKKISIKSFKVDKETVTPFIPFDIFTRAVMAAEISTPPKLEANFFNMSREELFRERYIDSFRYSFLLIESVYGEGKFRSMHLKEALKRNTNFVEIVSDAITNRIKPKEKKSDTERLLLDGVGVDVIIDHLVDKRGFYFHGNTSRKNSWKPHEQQEAESLSLLSLHIASRIAADAALPMFGEVLSKRYQQAARSVGAIVTTKVSYKFRDPIETFDREGHLVMNVPGTKPTAKLAVHLAEQFLTYFKETFPNCDLKSATCVVSSTGETVFSLNVEV